MRKCRPIPEDGICCAVPPYDDSIMDWFIPRRGFCGLPTL